MATQEKVNEARAILKDSGYDAIKWMRDNPTDAAVFGCVCAVAGFLAGLGLG